MTQLFALAAAPFTAESLAELFTAITGKPVTPAEMAAMREALAEARVENGEADDNPAQGQTVTPLPLP